MASEVPGLFRGHRAYVLGMLALVYTFNYVDRQILIILAEPIKLEFGLKDWHLGFLTGTAFAIFYATLGIPIARLADQWNRVNIIAGALAIWSAMTTICAASASFAQLAAARIGVGVGEAGGSPPAASILADYFDERERATAMGVYALGPTLGILVGFLVGGWVNQWYGWRSALIAVGVPGLMLAIAVKLTVREPARSTSPATQPVPKLGESIRMLFAIHACRWVNFAAIAAGFAFYGVMVWTPVLLIRKFGMTTGEVGSAVGLIAGFAGSIGVFTGGFLADRLALRDKRWVARVPALTTLLVVPCVGLMLLAPTAPVALALLVPVFLLALAYTGPTWAILQTAVPPGMRAMAAAVMLLLVNLIGLGLGPQAIGIVSDLRGASAGTIGLESAMGLASCVSLVASACFWVAANGMSRESADSRIPSKHGLDSQQAPS